MTYITKNVLDILGVDFQAQAFLLKNPGFEDWSAGFPIGWDRTGSGTIVQQPGYEGSYSAFIDATGGDTYLSQAYIPIRTNRNYRISCFAQPGMPTGPGGGGPGITIRLQAIDQYNVPQQEFITASYPSGSTGCQHLSAQGQLTYSDNSDVIVQIRVKVYVKNGQSAYFDSVVVEELP